ncbi:MAG: GNAT family N-acetyltransferase [Acidimicrobiia bacterium]|nr:GNAT family N-acetyltransferase [Acidimicrobiia bacterium]
MSSARNPVIPLSYPARATIDDPGYVRRVPAPFDDRPTLRGRHVELVPLDVRYVDELVEAASGDRDTYGFTEVPATRAQMAAYVERFVAQRERREAVPFVQRRVADDRVVGCTRFLELRWWRGRTDPDEVEIGGTWLAADAQRSPVNTEAKLLLLAHAFDTWGVWRVALCTDARNERSRSAIERIGAQFEGIVRNHRLSTVDGETGRPRQTALFSLVVDEWPRVRQRLLDKLG